jgi:ABC-2 type transport system ATP-binding protein
MKIITKRDKKSTGTKEVKLHTGTKKVPVSKYAIEVNDITVSAKKSIFTKRVNLISNVSFNVPIGNVTVFIGHNGAGKTTTTKAILDFVKLDTGSIKIFGVDHKNHNSRKDIGYIPEKNDIKNITVNEFFHQIGAFYDLNTKQTNERVLDLIKFFDFSKSNLKKRINKLSSGEKKIINFIQAFFVQHSLILMDEPTDNLDPQTRDLFWEFIEHYRKQHPQTSFLIVTHNLDEIQKYADYLIFMNKGIIKQTMKYDGHEGLRHLYKNLRDK